VYIGLQLAGIAGGRRISSRPRAGRTVSARAWSHQGQAQDSEQSPVVTQFAIARGSEHSW